MQLPFFIEIEFTCNTIFVDMITTISLVNNHHHKLLFFVLVISTFKILLFRPPVLPTSRAVLCQEHEEEAFRDPHGILASRAPSCGLGGGGWHGLLVTQSRAF